MSRSCVNASSSVTLYGSIYKLRRATELLAPDHDVSWLGELEKDLDLMKQPKSKLNRLVLAEVLVTAGLTLMTEADAAAHRKALQRATQHRNGLMIALLACCPIRLKNFAALSLGETLVQIEDCWWIVLTADQTKEKRPDERRIPDFLNPYVDQYVAAHRAVLAKSEEPNTACWLSRCGAPMSYLGVEESVTRTALATTGIAVSPHLFRMSAATTAAIHAGATPHLASAILDHRDVVTTQNHYNRASSLTAGKIYLALAETYRKQ